MWQQSRVPLLKRTLSVCCMSRVTGVLVSVKNPLPNPKASHDDMDLSPSPASWRSQLKASLISSCTKLQPPNSNCPTLPLLPQCILLCRALVAFLKHSLVTLLCVTTLCSSPYAQNQFLAWLRRPFHPRLRMTFLS